LWPPPPEACHGKFISLESAWPTGYECGKRQF
jgi:hypothetical protein